MSSVCVVCKEPSLLKCAGCYGVVYCSKKHQKQHWKIHRLECLPYKVAENHQLGRHLISIRNVPPGEIILRESAVVSGPMQITPPVCLGCHKLLTEFNSVDCSRCGWPLCSSACEKSTSHRPECDATCQYKKCKVKIRVVDSNLPHPSYSCLTVLRCLLLKKSNPDLWKKINNLQSHSEEIKSTPQYFSNQKSIAQFIPRFFQINEFSEEDIMHVAGIVQTNAHEVPLTEPEFISIYETASFLEHNCRSNCSKSFASNGDIIIRTMVPVAAGEHFSICYTDPMWGTASRRLHLWQTKFFQCNCTRCSDPTELGTHFSSLLCNRRECNGYVIPATTLAKFEESDDEEEISWFCQSCDVKFSSYDVMKRLERIGNALKKVDKKKEDDCRNFIREHEKILHPNHYFLSQVKLALAQLYGQEKHLSSIEDDQLSLKMEYCKQLYDLATKLIPAENRLRGLLLFELHAAIAESGRRKSNNKDIDSLQLKKNLLECRKILLQAHELLRYEPNILPEGKIAIQAEKNLHDLDKLLD